MNYPDDISDSMTAEIGSEQEQDYADAATAEEQNYDYRFLVKGAYFRGSEAKELSDSLEVGAEVTIQREKDNEHDEFACSVHYEGIHIGYVQTELAFAVAALFDDGGHTEIPAKLIGREISATGRVSYPEVAFSV